MSCPDCEALAKRLALVEIFLTEQNRFILTEGALRMRDPEAHERSHVRCEQALRKIAEKADTLDVP